MNLRDPNMSPLATTGIALKKSSNAGAALLFTLAGLVLISILILVFLSTAKNERISASLYTRGEQARLLRESVVNLVIAQIRQGTADSSRLWISQPGAIRTYSGSKQPDQVYKLYSAREMVVPGSSFNPATLDDVPTGGGALDANVFTDLNAPVLRDSKWNYPILDPAALGVVEGFQENATAAGVKKNTIPGNPAQIPMPVRWLYLLESGGIASVDDAGVVQGAGPTDQIVARVAFWTDDESAKLNINTASSGRYWDTPIGKGNDFETGAFAAAGTFPVVTRSGLASSQPAVKEFQRYPGHPATTSLDVVFNNTTFFDASLNPAQRVQKILEISPRNQWGGSEHGAKFPVTTQPGGIVTLDSDRLYATVDELFYKHPASSDASRPSQGNASSSAPVMRLTPETLSLAKFFLTAHSRTPEVTAFNTPRVTAWPVDINPANRSLFDKTIAFCSKVGNIEYLFTRSAFNAGNITMSGFFTGASSQGSQSATNDYTLNNQRIYSYLDGLMSKTFPGFGASLGSKFGADRQQILTQIYDYIRSTNLFDCSESTAKPYTGRPFYWNEANRLAAGAGNVNGLLRSDLPLPRDPGALSPPLQLEYYVPSAYAGQVVPARIGSTRGFGRFPTIVGATLVFFATDSDPPANRNLIIAKHEGLPEAAFPGVGNATSIQPFTSNRTRAALTSWAPASFDAGKIRAALVLSMANPGAGAPAYTHTYDIEVRGLDQFQVNSQSLNMPSPAINRIMAHEGFFGNQVWATGFIGPRIFTSATEIARREYRDIPKEFISPATGNNTSAYPFFSQSDISVSSPTLNFSSSAPLDIDIRVDGQVVQNIQMTFPPFTAPMPRWSPAILTNGGSLVGYTTSNGTFPKSYTFIDGSKIDLSRNFISGNANDGTTRYTFQTNNNTGISTNTTYTFTTINGTVSGGTIINISTNNTTTTNWKNSRMNGPGNLDYRFANSSNPSTPPIVGSSRNFVAGEEGL
jgi:uncharacterized protein (TIGR02600 family)